MLLYSLSPCWLAGRTVVAQHDTALIVHFDDSDEEGQAARRVAAGVLQPRVPTPPSMLAADPLQKKMDEIAVLKRQVTLRANIERRLLGLLGTSTYR